MPGMGEILFIAAEHKFGISYNIVTNPFIKYSEMPLLLR
jgi:hypothetical protein